LIDLHLHSTASDGRLSPAAVVDRAHAAGLTTIALTDHDTVAGLDEARAAADAAGLRLVPGIEITAVEGSRDVHVLGYFFDPAREPLHTFLSVQRTDRVRRLREIGARLTALGYPVDLEPMLQDAELRHGKSVGRPLVADALIAAGHVVDRRDAFDNLLGAGRPGFVARVGAPVREVIEILHRAGGIAALAHPGPLEMDDAVEGFVRAGLDAIEARHSDHDEATEQRYREMAGRFGLAVCGGSDFHGDPSRRVDELGIVTLPESDFLALEATVRRP
jgi:predicted metal-dependent phosphoesterase TrpH